jgi:hypothetical protein
MKYVLCFGNPYLEGDNKVVNSVDSLEIKNIQFVKCKNPDIIFSYLDKDFIILDVAKGIKEPVFISDADKFNFDKMISLHDFDLNFFLKLIKEFDINVRVLAIPIEFNEEKIRKTIIDYL